MTGGLPSTAGLRTQLRHINDLSVYINDNMYMNLGAKEMGRYYSDQVPQKAEVIIPRNTIGNYYGDIGFRRPENGDYTLVIDNLDQNHVHNSRFIPQLRAAYKELSENAGEWRGSTNQRIIYE